MKSKKPKTTNRHLHKGGDINSHQMHSTPLARKQLASFKPIFGPSCFLASGVDAKTCATLRF